jgi:ornithine--oxo-acid transaminase
VARASLAALEDEKLHERADALGREFLARLKSISSRHIRAVRGRGLLIGMELHPEAGGARRFCEALMADGVLCKETHVDVIRFAPPLVITAEQLAWVADRVADVMGRL